MRCIRLLGLSVGLSLLLTLSAEAAISRDVVRLLEQLATEADSATVVRLTSELLAGIEGWPEGSSGAVLPRADQAELLRLMLRHRNGYVRLQAGAALQSAPDEVQEAVYPSSARGPEDGPGLRLSDPLPGRLVWLPPGTGGGRTVETRAAEDTEDTRPPAPPYRRPAASTWTSLMPTGASGTTTAPPAAGPAPTIPTLRPGALLGVARSCPDRLVDTGRAMEAAAR